MGHYGFQGFQKQQVSECSLFSLVLLEPLQPGLSLTGHEQIENGVPVCGDGLEVLRVGIVLTS